ncbi:uncharacterized protein LOC134531700 [Bacillus rossius redtenbacheri]|uniref:uncharacterized protein LOC134531700 n=1 Tax=Bacillus rossius redtenbacheri TaxID=93214 RepID=UPI002FDEADB6
MFSLLRGTFHNYCVLYRFSRGRRRSRWKLKFHHQALPPEYLDHYEAAMAQQDAAAKSAPVAKSESKSKPACSTTKALPPLVPRSVMTEKKFDNLLHLIKKDQEAVKLGPSQPPALRNLRPADQLHFTPTSTLGVNSESELLNRLQQNTQRYQADDRMAIEKTTVSEKRTGASNNASRGKGLLGSLLSGNASPEISIKACSETDRKKRSSVIITNCASTNLNRTSTPATTSAPTTSRVMKYQDLPYMGEITLDNTKPRRGRKPKKADICHLIYKNYGTIFPGAPNQNAAAETEDVLKMKSQGAAFSSTYHTNSKLNKKDGPLPTGIKCRPLDSLKSSPPINHADVQNRIISSLLEKRLTAASMDAKRNALSLESSLLRHAQTDGENTTNRIKEPWLHKHIIPPSDGADEPLNLCIKDLNQLKIRLLRKHGNFYEPRSNNNVMVKSEPNSPSEVEQIELRDSPKENMSTFSDDAESTGTSSSRNQTPLSRQLEQDSSLSFPSISTPAQFPNPSLLPTDAINPITSGYVYWPNAGVFVHPMALQSQLLYYQKMGAIPILPVPPVEPLSTFIPSPIAPNTLIPNLPAILAAQRNDTGDSHVKDHQRQTASCIKPCLPKGFSSILHTKPTEMPSELSFPRMKRLAPLGNLPHAGSTSTTKRKRSAIFIPPMPSENNNNPTTEVSICKFKFTGGAKPSLQEKKMLSVDSGGNFRYYSGTGDKSMRGYEFFPRESLHPSTGSNNVTSQESNFALSTMGVCDSTSPNNQHVGHPTTFTEKAKPNFPISDVRLDHQMYVPGFNDSILDTLESDTLLKPRETEEDQFNQNVGVDFNKKLSAGDEADSYAANKADESCSLQLKTRRKRKTRKSLAREKLEQTFKEKGFLIQTQQLESAEGATYCKFRQLRKFTRYLFRSWKDYLPGNVREMSLAAGVGGSGTSPVQRDMEVERELSSNSPHSNQESTEVVQPPPTE